MLNLKSIKIICFALFFSLFIVGCQQNVVCTKPYILIGNSCCLDKNNNGICDKDEQEEFQKNVIATAEPKKEAETTALRFARTWEAKDWNPMYDLFTDDLKKLKSKERFVKAAAKLTSREKKYIIRLDEVRLDNGSTGYAYYTKSYTESAAERKEPAIKLVQNENEWKVETFIKYFNACDEFSKECCGNHLCEKNESVHSLNNYIKCPSDCFELDSYLDKNKKEADFAFLGKAYHFQILNITGSEKEGHSLRLRYNDRAFTLDESSYGKYPVDHNVDGNVYIKFRYLNNVITITLFNKEK